MSAHPLPSEPTRPPRLSVLPSPPSSPTIDADTYRSVFRGHAGGVSIITAGAGQGPVGFTATSVVSVSLDPPMLSFAIAESSSSWPTVLRADRVAVHFLDVSQTELARRFATRGADRFGHPIGWDWSADGPPVLHDPPCLVIGVVQHRFTVGDHHLVVARLERADQRRSYRPLVYAGGQYASARPRI